MLNLKIYIVNAFAGSQFGGNPAAVIPLDKWLNDALMQQIAAQNNLAETAFIVPLGEGYAIRWFTPTVEVDLCGHATLASAHVFFHHLGYQYESIEFHSKSGRLEVLNAGQEGITLDFPADPPVPVAAPEILERALGIRPLGLYRSTFDYMAVLGDPKDVENLNPDLRLIAQLSARGIIVTSRGSDTDFVSRCFFPQSGIDEDPVTGSAHTAMVPYWAEQYGKTKLSAVQLSRRRGFLACEMRGDRVLMSGRAFTYLIGEIAI